MGSGKLVRRCDNLTPFSLSTSVSHKVTPFLSPGERLLALCSGQQVLTHSNESFTVKKSTSFSERGAKTRKRRVTLVLFCDFANFSCLGIVESVGNVNPTNHSEYGITALNALIMFQLNVKLFFLWENKNVFLRFFAVFHRYFQTLQ